MSESSILSMVIAALAAVNFFDNESSSTPSLSSSKPIIVDKSPRLPRNYSQFNEFLTYSNYSISSKPSLKNPTLSSLMCHLDSSLNASRILKNGHLCSE